MSLQSWFQDRRIRRLRDRLDSAVAELEAVARRPSGEADLSRTAKVYGRAMRLALQVDPGRAVAILGSFDHVVPDEQYGRAFQPSDADWLRFVGADDPDGLTAVFEVATRLRAVTLQRDTSDRLLRVLSQGSDTARLVTFLQRLQRLELLPPDRLTAALTEFVRHASFDHDGALWTSFFDTVPESSLPRIFDVLLFLGRGQDAAALADTAERKERALRCCLGSRRMVDVDAADRLAQELSDPGALRMARERRGDLLVEAGRDEEALESYRLADRPDRMSECYERLGRLTDALRTCPADAADRLAHLAHAAHREIDALVEGRDFIGAAAGTAALVEHLDRPAGTESVLAARESAAALLAAVLVAGRDHFAQLVATAEPDGRAAIRLEWSHFEEAAGDQVRAAQLAAEAGDRYRAHRLFRAAGRFGDAVRTLEGDQSTDSLQARARASADGGDPGGAARLHERAGHYQPAAQEYELAGEFAAAARCWRRHLGEDAVKLVGSVEFVRCLRRARAYGELVEVCAEAIQRRGRQSPAVTHLTELLRVEADSLDPDVEQAARAALDSVSSQDRVVFEQRAPIWVERARTDVDHRYAGVWGLDLGTTTSVAAIYDSVLGRAVCCPWNGQEQFASTLSLVGDVRRPDTEYTEVIGLAGEETLGKNIVGHISGAKRRLGSSTTYRIRDRSYRPEDIAGRVIRHAARRVVEGFLRGQVRERVAELARAELANVPDRWLDWVDQQHDLRITRSRVVITVPAFFENNQKNAARDAGEIAGVEVRRLIHEPTAACIAVHRERRLEQNVVVVDLGAGTLDLSLIDLGDGDGLYDVQQVDGDTRYGGRDFDTIISGALAEELAARAQGIVVGETGSRRRRLDVAAEHLKIALSSQHTAEYVLTGFDDAHENVTLTLGRDELEGLLADSLQPLRDTCTRFRENAIRRTGAAMEGSCSLVLVGGPMLTPAVRRVVEEAFRLTAVGVNHPRTAVACGAALQGAVLDNALQGIVLLDVTPLALGIETKNEGFTTLIEANTTIPTQVTKMFTTTQDYQSEVKIQVYQGSLTSKIGQFRLEGILPAPAGTPHIDVTFSIDANCVLTVTARTETGASKSITVTDTTLLSPRERQRLATKLAEQQERQGVRADAQRLLAAAAERLADTDDLVRTWRGRLDGYRPSTADPDPTIRAALTEMFTTGTEVESELVSIELVLRDLVANLRAHLERSGHDFDVATTRNLCEQLETNLNRYLELRNKIGGWNAMLIRAAGAQTDPLANFLTWHAAGDHVRALEALARYGVPLVDLDHIRKHLDSLANVGDATGYDALLREHATQLGAVPVDAADPSAFLAWARTAVALIRAPSGPTGAGFVRTDRLVLANRRLVVPRVDGSDVPTDPGDLDVLIDGRARPAHRIITSPRAEMLALIELDESVETKTLRVGHSGLIRVGDPVHAVEIDAHGVPNMISGTVQGLDRYSEQNPLVLRVELPAGSRPSDCALFNAAGEAIAVPGVVPTTKDGGPTTKDDSISFAITLDSADQLLSMARPE